MKIALKAANGRFVCAENGGDAVGIVRANREAIGPWETFAVTEEGEAIALQSSGGRFLCAEEGGGGALHANRQAIGPWEQFTVIGSLSNGPIGLRTRNGHFVCAEVGSPDPIVNATRTQQGPWETFEVVVVEGAVTRKRRGIVRATGRVFTDDDGLFHPLGASLFWAVWGWKFDRERTRRNLAFLRTHGVDYIRAFGEVGGRTWEDRTIDPAWSDYESQLAGVIDACYDEFGMRVELTVFAGGTGRNPSDVLAKVVNVVRGREHKILHMEGANESFATFRDTALLRDLVRRGRAQLPSTLWAVSSPADGNAVEINQLMAGGVGQVATAHLSRQNNLIDGGWRQVRQAWELRDLGFLTSQNEPAGPQSSVATNEDPLQLAMMRLVGILSGVGAYVLHSGAGVRGGGAADLALGRSTNIFEVPNIEAILKGLRGVDTLIPQDLENWTKANNHWRPPLPAHPLPADQFWVDGADHGVVRNYSAFSGSEFVTLPIGVKRHVVFTARDRCQIDAFDPLTLARTASATVNAGGTFQLPGGEDAGTAYIIRGRR